MTEAEKVLILIELFEWPDDKYFRFDALRLLRQARGEPYPRWDDFELGT